MARWHLRWNRIEGALPFAEQAFTLVKKYRLYHMLTAPAGSLYLKCLRLYLNHQRNKYPPTPKRNKKHLVKAASFIVNATNRCRTEKVSALRELGLAYRVDGNMQKAKRYIRQSVDLAKKRQMPFELAQSNLAMALVERDIGNSSGEHAIETATNEIEKFDVVNFRL